MKNEKISLIVIFLQILAFLMCALNAVKAYTDPNEAIKTPWIWIASCVLWLLCVILGIINHKKKFGKIGH